MRQQSGTVSRDVFSHRSNDVTVLASVKDGCPLPQKYHKLNELETTAIGIKRGNDLKHLTVLSGLRWRKGFSPSDCGSTQPHFTSAGRQSQVCTMHAMNLRSGGGRYCVQCITANAEDQSPCFSARSSPCTKITFGATSGAGTYFRPCVSMTPRPVEAHYSSHDGDTRGSLLLRVQCREVLDQNSEVENAMC